MRRFIVLANSLSLRALLLIGIFTGVPSPVQSCTTMVISGRFTQDGRPLLWKNRDTSSSRNEIAYLDDGELKAVAVADAGKRASIWMGCNDAGFCIENSLSKDLNVDGPKNGPGNGSLMKLALQTCRTAADFEALLDRTNASGRSTIANYGIIDANGAAMIFETGPKSFVKFDANDASQFPDGFVVRTNFATTAQSLPPNPTVEEVEQAEVYSGRRYTRAVKLLENASGDLVDIRYVLRTMTRDMADERGVPYPGSAARNQGVLPRCIDTSSTISRTTTVSAVVFQGVKPGEDPLSTVMWTLLGDPKFSIAVPCWATQREIADPMEDADGAELGEIARTLRDWSLPHDREGIETDLLPGIWMDLWSLEDQFIDRVAQARAAWLDEGYSPEQADRLHRETATSAMSAIKRELEQAKEQILTAATETQYSDEIRSSSQSIRVAVYNHSTPATSGVTNLQRILTEELGFTCETIHPDQIRPDQISQYDLLIVPGGSGSLQAKKLGLDGRDAIRQYVANGGGYVGICAGSYLASSQYSWSLHLVNAKVFDRVHWARGTGVVELELTEDGVEAFGAHSQSLMSQLNASPKTPVYYGQGPLLLPARNPNLPGYEVLASYRSGVSRKSAPVNAMLDTHAIIRTEYGLGRVVCISPHPEKSQGPEWMIESLARWAARDQANRYRFADVGQ